MEKPDRTRIGDRASTPPAPLRLLVMLVVMLQLAGPVGYALAEAPPPAPSHLAHLGAPDDTGCRPFHDDAFCGSCRVLSTHPLRTAASPALPSVTAARAAGPRSSADGLSDDPAIALRRARAPPRG